MTISSSVRKAGPFAGNDVTTEFQFTFKVFTTADVLVVRADSVGAEYTLVLTTDYTVSLNANQNTNPGGTVTKNTALATGDSLIIASKVGNLQPVDLTNGGGFYPDVINSALDRATIQIQQLDEKVDRSIKVTITSDLTPDEFVTQLQQGASEASASASAAAASAALAATFVPANYAELAGADFTGAVTVATTLDVTGAASVDGLLTAGGGVAVPAGETGANAPQAQETALIATTQFGFRNKVVNGNFAINQRGVSGSVVLAAGAYGHDMWKAGASGCSYTFATSAGVTTLTISAGSLIQPIDGDSLRTETCTLSWTGTAQGKIGAGSYSATGVTGAVTGGSNTTIEFNTGTLSLVQLEPGEKPTVYEFIGKEADLFRCEPYYEIIRYKASGVAAISSLLSAGADYFQWSFRRVKKSAPTITLVSGAWVGGTPTISVSLDGASFLRATGGFNANGVAGAVCLSASSPL